MTPAVSAESPVEELLRSLTDRESDLTITLDGLEIQFPFLREPLRMKGTLSVRLNMHETPPSGPRARRRA